MDANGGMMPMGQPGMYPPGQMPMDANGGMMPMGQPMYPPG
jgi:hypothetical protein